jgi:hypothetical protein
MVADVNWDQLANFFRHMSIVAAPSTKLHAWVNRSSGKFSNDR